jgi:hypothetical protein
MKKLPWIACAIIALSTSSCVFADINGSNGSGRPVEETYYMNNFNEVEVSSAMNVTIVPSTEFRVTANGAERDVDDLNIRVINRTLYVEYRNKNWFRGRSQMNILIETPTLDEVDASGACKLEIEDFSSFRLLEIDLSGASELTLDVPTDNLDVELSGASTVTVKQPVSILSADLSGASRLYAFDAYASRADLELSGSSRANVSVSDYLKVEASGASVVNYKGSPRIDQELTGGSKINRN